MTVTREFDVEVFTDSCQGGRKYMEDTFCVAFDSETEEVGTDTDRDNSQDPKVTQEQPKRHRKYLYSGIFDGHGGKEAALFARDHLLDNIVSHEEFWSDDDDSILKAISLGFVDTHLSMVKELDTWPTTSSGLPSTSGTTASICFIMNGKVYTGHVGDSRIVLGRKNRETGFWIPKPLTKDHKPDSPEEKERISKAGGEVMTKSGVERVVWFRPKNGHQGPIRRSTNIDRIPFLAVARSLGDLWSYNPDNDTYVVSPEPDVNVTPLTEDDKCLILASDGLWNMLLDYESVRLVQEAHDSKEIDPFLLKSLKDRKTEENPSQLLVQYALQKWTSSCLRADNTSAVTLILKPSKSSSIVYRSLHPSTQVPSQPITIPQTQGLPSSFTVTYKDPQFMKLTAVRTEEDEDFALLSPSMQSLCKFTRGSIDSLSPKFSYPSIPVVDASITHFNQKGVYVNDLPDESFSSLSNSLRLKQESSPKVISGVTVFIDIEDDVLDGLSIPGKRDRSCSVNEGMMEVSAMKHVKCILRPKTPVNYILKGKNIEPDSTEPEVTSLEDESPVTAPVVTPVIVKDEERILKPVDSFATNLDNASSNKQTPDSSGSRQFRGKKRRKSKQKLSLNPPTKRLRNRTGLLYAKSVYQRMTQSIASRSRSLRSRKAIKTVT